MAKKPPCWNNRRALSTPRQHYKYFNNTRVLLQILITLLSRPLGIQASVFIYLIAQDSELWCHNRWHCSIINKQGLSFVYEREDGKIITHNAVYPREIFTDKNNNYFKAYCYFTKDTRTFRLDRVKSLQSFSKKEPLTLRNYIVVLAVIALCLACYVPMCFGLSLEGIQRENG